jgi:hypothetical protein
MDKIYEESDKMRKQNNLQKRNLGIVVIVATLIALSATMASAASVNVVAIGGYDGNADISGGLPNTGTPGFSAFTFATLAPGSVTLANLAPYDTVVLNMASGAMGCNANTLSTSAKAAINTFAANGGKVIIQDAECTFGGSVDYSWLTFPFTTSNPGAFGASGGTLNIIENDGLATSTAGPKFIDTNAITSQTDAVGDMNVVVTKDSNWCLSMTGTNVQQTTGATQMYAKPGNGLFIYNGLDTNFINYNGVDPSGGGQLTKIWLQQLQVNNTQQELPCGAVVSGIGLLPLTATNPVGTTHTVDATVTANGVGQPNVVVTFTVTSGPNTGITGSSTTDSNGQASFSYTGSGGAGTDEIKACFIDQTGTQICSKTVTKEWIAAPAKGSISGMKFNDLNGNGVNDVEPGLASWTITLTNDTGVTITQTTAPDGSYNFTNLTDGNYTVGEVIQPGWIQTAPAVSAAGSATYTVNISGGNNVAAKDFGNFQFGSVSGTKFEDLNANGVRDPNESGLAGWNITINGTDSITGTTVNQTTTTDANGNYNFTGLTAGTYTISETPKDGWVQTAPATGIYTVTITSEAVITGQDFGNFHKGKITGGGWISITGDPKATFGIVGQYPDASNTASGSVEYQDHIANLNIKSIQINTVATTLDKKKGTITGLATVNGAGSYPFVVYVEDNAEPGKGADVFMISLPTYPYSNGTILSGGNIQIHS